jgi:HD-like signal output (HDOD) protein
MDKKLILFVDDDAQALEDLKKKLSSMTIEWEMYYVKSGWEALSLIKDFVFDAVVADAYMPVIDGSQILQEAMEHNPECVRYILSEKSDEYVLLHSVRCVHQFIPKPCDVQLLTRSLARAFALRDLLRSEKLKALVAKIRVIPSLPEVYYELMEELRSEDPSTRKIGKILEKDLGMTAKVLQLVNSAFFGLAGRISDPVQAAVYLGIDTLKSLVLVFHVFSALDSAKVPGFSAKKLLQHSMVVGRAAQILTRKMSPEQSMAEDSFMAGLFHDIGKLILAANLPDHYREAMTYHVEHGLSFCESEESLLGSSHAEVGAYVLGLWGFGDPVVEACAFHHFPSQNFIQAFSPLTAVHVANSIYHETYPEEGTNCDMIDLLFLARLGLQKKLQDWRNICQDVFRKQEESAEDIIR